MAKACLAEAVSSGSSLEALLSKHLETDAVSPSLEQLAQDLIRAYPEEANLVRNGQDKVIMRLIGQGMRLSKGKADAKRLGQLLKSMLHESA